MVVDVALINKILMNLTQDHQYMMFTANFHHLSHFFRPPHPSYRIARRTHDKEFDLVIDNILLKFL